MLRTAGFIMHIFATSFQAITVQSNCYANFPFIKGSVKREKRLFFFSRAFFQAAVIRSYSLCRMKKKNLRRHRFMRRVSLAWKPNWMPCHQVFKLWFTSLAPGRALDQLCHWIQTSKKIFCRRKTMMCTTQQKVSSVIRSVRTAVLKSLMEQQSVLITLARKTCQRTVLNWDSSQIPSSWELWIFESP